jgi:hypothetical protein
LRTKGEAKQLELDRIRAELIELHLGGSKDPRLGTLAAAVKLQLPRRQSRT